MASQEIMISGAQACSGSIKISGAKNATLPLMAACLLTDEKVVLENVPDITDVNEMKNQLGSYGAQTDKYGSRRVLQATRRQTSFSPTSSHGSKTRGSFLVLGPLLARFGKAQVYRPGGCQIGRNGRPVNYHINALKKMGATVEEDTEYVLLKADQGLRGARIDCKHSVGATETVIMAACLADGQTKIRNAAIEPEIIDLIEMLNKMGMDGSISVDESEKRIVIDGRNGRLLNGCTHTVIPDRIEAGTWAIAAAMTGGSLLLMMNPETGKRIMVPVLQKLQQAGVSLQWRRNGLEVQRYGQIYPVNVTTGPFPKFPTDLLPPWVTFMTLANGPSILVDTIYDNRFKLVQYLEEMGAEFTRFSDGEYKVHGYAKLTGKHVVATDLRAGAALVLAALVASHSTKIKDFQHVLRGYENIREKLKCWKVTIDDLSETRGGFYGGENDEPWPCVLF